MKPFSLSCIDADLRVSYFISEHRTWDVPSVLASFHPSEAASILALPISLREMEDCRVWPLTPTGVYSVRTGYRMALRWLDCFQNPVGQSGGVDRFWKFLWHQNVPPCVKHFSWQACQEIIPCRVNLFQRGVVNDHMCLVCGMVAESPLHALKDCSWSRAYWFASPLGVCMDYLAVPAVLDWFKFFFCGTPYG